MDKKIIGKYSLKDFLLLTLASFLLVIGVVLFKYPNNFSFGGVTGISIVLAKFLPVSASTLNLVINILLLAVGVIILGKDFIEKTVYVTLVSSIGISVFDKALNLTAPLTDEPFLEFVFAVAVPGIAAAILFNMDASSGGTDIVAMILKKYTSLEIGTALFLADLLISVSTFFIFDIKTGLFSISGLLAKTLVIDSAIENFNLCKYFTIITTKPDDICDFIHHELHRSATIYSGEGTYTHQERKIILTVLKRGQAVSLRRFVKEADPNAFIMITNSSEIIGKGFRGFN